MIATASARAMLMAMLMLANPWHNNKHVSAFVDPQPSFHWKLRDPSPKSDAEYAEYGSNIKVFIPAQGDLPVKTSVYAPNGVAEAFAWTVPMHIHPERNSDFPVGQWLAKKANVGIALSGGGMRAAACTLGWLRTLNEAGLLQRARYLSANSGATWVTVPLAAKELLHRLEGDGPFPYEAYLGKYVPPEEIRGDNEELGSIGVVLAESNIIADPKQSEKVETEHITARHLDSVVGVDIDVSESHILNGEVDSDVTLKKVCKSDSPVVFDTGDQNGGLTWMKRFRFSMWKPLRGIVGNVVRPIYGVYLNFTPRKANFTAWVAAIDSNFVKPMGISSSSREFYDKLQRAYLWKNTSRQMQPSEFPFPIYVATAHPEGDRPGIAVPYEFTPFYSGTPMDPRIFNNPNLAIGGGLVEYRVFDTTVDMPPLPFDATKDFPNVPYVVQLPAPERVLNIAEVTGISSSFFGAAVVDLGLRQRMVDTLLRFLPGIPDHVKKFTNPTKYQYWSPESGGPSKGLSFVDGGLYDNTGVLALLRRNCSCIIACVATGSAIYDEDPLKNGDRFGDIAALFGQQQEPWIDTKLKRVASLLVRPRRIWNRSLSFIGFKLRNATRPPIPSPNVFQVFHADMWKVLVEELAAKYKKGVPQVVKMNLDVMENPKAGVFGNRTVELIVCFNGRVNKSWRDKLTREDLKKKISPRDGSSENVGPEKFHRWVYGLKKSTKLSEFFPYFSTFRVIYDRSTVNMMAHLSSFALKKGLEEVGFNINDYN